MDPNATLNELRKLLDDKSESDGDIGRVAELFSALDHWLSNSGFLPRDWKQHVVSHVGENVD